MLDKIRFEGLTLTVEDVQRSIEYYGDKLGLTVEVNAAPAFAMIRAPGGGTIGLLAIDEARKEGVAAVDIGAKAGHPCGVQHR